MNRRGHLSHKVPNVKLRPAPAMGVTTSRSKDKQKEVVINAMDEEVLRRAWDAAEDEEASTSALRSTKKPWENVVLTFTGVENKQELSVMAKELGAAVESALTIAVTHVVASGYGSAKYLYAIEHQLPVMAPSWIIMAHDRWLKAEDLNPEQDLEHHRLQPFLGLRVAISGIEPIERRKQLVRYINDYGGIYSKDLDRSCSHLVLAKSSTESKGSEKVKWALKELQDRDIARRRGKKVEGDDIKIVYEEWIWDCVAYNGRWKEADYDARKPKKQGRVTANDVLNDNVVLGPSKSETNPAETAPEPSEPAVMRKRKRDPIDSLVGDIISMTSAKGEEKIRADEEMQDAQPIAEPSNHAVPFEDKEGTKAEMSDRSILPDKQHLERRPTEVDPISTRPEREQPERRPTKVDRKPSILHTSRHTSFAAPLPPTAKLVPSVDPSLPPTATIVRSEVQQDPAAPAVFFAGLRFSHNIAEHSEGLEKALQVHGGVFVPEKERLEGEEVDYVVVRLASGSNPVLLSSSKEPRVVTECWVEGCCFEQRLLSPDSHLVFQPLPAAMPISGASSLLVHLSGFSTADVVYLKRLLKAIGGQLSVKLNRQASHLVCAQPSGQKYEKALEWGVTVVRDSWLLAMGRSGNREPEDEHWHDLAGPSNSALNSGRLYPRLSTATTSNMSAVSELGETIQYGRTKTEILDGASLSAAKIPSQQSNFSPARALKLTPTHIDDVTRTSGTSFGSGGHLDGIDLERKPSIGHALSPPKPETERMMNQAGPFRMPTAPEPRSTSPHENHDGKLSRTSSAPPAGDSPTKGRGQHSLGKAQSTAGRIEKAKETTEMLRLLAQHDKSSPANRNKLVRRSRPTSRLRHATSITTSHFNTTTSVSPTSRYSSPPGDALDTPNTSVGMMDGLAEESMRVTYVDPEAAKTKRKLMEALRRGAAEGDETPMKKSKGSA